MYVQTGDSFRALSTQDIRDCGIVPGSAGRVEGVQGCQVSFYLERGGPGQGAIVAHSDLADFNKNFVPDKSKDSGRRSRETSNLYRLRFPNDFRTGRGRR